MTPAFLSYFIYGLKQPLTIPDGLEPPTSALQTYAIPAATASHIIL